MITTFHICKWVVIHVFESIVTQITVVVTQIIITVIVDSTLSVAYRAELLVAIIGITFVVLLLLLLLIIIIIIIIIINKIVGTRRKHIERIPISMHVRFLAFVHRILGQQGFGRHR